MVCHYCNTRNAPGSAVCNSCGAILREIKRARPAPKEKGHIAGPKALLMGGKYRAQHAALQTRIKAELASVQERAEKELDKNKEAAQHDPVQPPIAHARLTLGAVHLLQDEIERSVQEFQQAQRAGATGSEFFNNAGVSLARRGNLRQAVDMFDKATATDPLGPEAAQSVPPRSNMVHALARLSEHGDTKVAEHAIYEVQMVLTADPKNPTHYNRLGLILCAERRYEEALVQFARARELSAGTETAEADAINNQGIAQALDGDLSAAAQSFEDALARDHGHGRALCNRALIALQKGETEAALERLQRAVRLDPQSALVRSNHGYGLSRVLAINEGIREFKEAILHDGQALAPYYNQGKSYADEGLTDVAERYLTRAHQLDPDCWQVLVAVGFLKYHHGQTSQALQSFQSANSLHPNDPLIMNNLGVCLALTGAEAGAERLFKQAGQIAKNDPASYQHLAWLYLRRANISQAKGELEIALGIDDRLPIAHNNIGLCEVEQGSYEEAVGHFRRALALDPAIASAHYHLGCAHLLLNQLDAAVREWEQAAKLEPNNADCFTNLGVAYFKMGKLDQAVTEFRRVVAMRQTRMEDYSNLGLAYAKQGVVLRQASRRPDDQKAKDGRDKSNAAIEMFDRSISLAPRNVMLHSNRGLACYFANRPEEAMTEWTLVTRLDPGYARRRARVQQSEFDETIVEYVPLDTAVRAMSLPIKTAGYLYQYVPGYDTDEWNLVLNDPSLIPVPEQIRQVRHLERLVNSL